MVPYRHTYGTVPVHLWCRTGTLLVPYRHTSGAVQAHLWYRTGTLLVPYRYNTWHLDSKERVSTIPVFLNLVHNLSTRYSLQWLTAQAFRWNVQQPSSVRRDWFRQLLQGSASAICVCVCVWKREKVIIIRRYDNFPKQDDSSDACTLRCAVWTWRPRAPSEALQNVTSDSSRNYTTLRHFVRSYRSRQT